MRFISLLTLSRVSTGLTVLVGAGVLVSAILTDNGGTASSQADWKEVQARIAEKSAVDTRRLTAPASGQGREWIDPVTTASVETSGQADSRAGQSESEPSVLSLIRENSDVAPAVSSGTGRVSVMVKKGDTLFSIGHRHGLSITDLARLNGLEEPYTIKVGQTLYVAR